MKKEIFEAIKSELRDLIDLEETNTRLEVEKLQSKMNGFREGMWIAIRSFEETIKK